MNQYLQFKGGEHCKYNEQITRFLSILLFKLMEFYFLFTLQNSGSLFIINIEVEDSFFLFKLREIYFVFTAEVNNNSFYHKDLQK